MAKRADPFPDTCWEITLCKYVGLQISSYIHSQSPHSIPIYNPGRAVRALSNDTPGIEYDFFLWLMGGDTQGVSVGGAVHQRPEKPRSIRIWAPAGAAWSSLRVHTHPWRVLVFSPVCVCVCVPGICIVASRFQSGISGLAQLTPVTQIRISLKFELDQVRCKCHMEISVCCWLSHLNTLLVRKCACSTQYHRLPSAVSWHHDACFLTNLYWSDSF